MESITLPGYAKINLSLDVLGKRPDGYHELQMIMQTVDLFDEVTVERAAQGVFITTDSGHIPAGPANTAYKAAKLVIEHAGISNGVRIHIKKRIPVAAGLAGGSADAAAVIHAMDTMFDLSLTGEQKAQIGLKVGADVPYCLVGGTMLAEGIGEKLTRLVQLEGHHVVLVKPPISVATAWVYGSLKLDANGKRPNTSRLLQYVAEQKVCELAGEMANVLEWVTMEKYAQIQEIKERLLELGASGSMMSGSGPTVFGLFADGHKAHEACEKLSHDQLGRTYHVRMRSV